MDDVFDLERGEFLAPTDRNANLDDLSTMNVGVMLLRPNASKVPEFLEMSEDTSKYNVNFYEQGFLNYYYEDLKARLPR
jgi:hypothetical protein